ncbi:hypothetical protein SVIOM342S_01401 [Streptomyces violaceorubidus]
MRDNKLHRIRRLSAMYRESAPTPREGTGLRHARRHPGRHLRRPPRCQGTCRRPRGSTTSTRCAAATSSTCPQTAASTEPSRMIDVRHRAGRRARRRRLRPDHRQARMRGGHRRTGHHRRRHRGRQRLPRRVAHAADRRPGRAHPAQDGVPARPAARRHDDADHQVRQATVPDTARAADMVSMAFPRVLPRCAGGRLEMPPATCWTPRCRPRRRGCRAARACRLPRRVGRRPGGRREAGRPAGARREARHPARQPVWTTRATEAAVELVRTLNVPAYMNSTAAAPWHRATRTTSSSPAATPSPTPT